MDHASESEYEPSSGNGELRNNHDDGVIGKDTRIEEHDQQTPSTRRLKQRRQEHQGDVGHGHVHPYAIQGDAVAHIAARRDSPALEKVSVTQGYNSATVTTKHQPLSARTTRVDGVTSPSEDELGGIGQQLLESESAKAEASWLRQAYRCQSENKSGAHRAVNRTPQGPTRELHALSPSADAGRRPHVTLETMARVTARPYDRRFTKTTKPTNARRRVC